MTTREPESARLSSLFMLVGLVACTGCGKPGAQAKADGLALQIRNEPGGVHVLREWYSSVSSALPKEPSVPLAIPESLQSEWWRSARAYAAWSDEGTLEKIMVIHGGPWEPFLVVGRPTATADSLGLTQKAGEPPAFYAAVTNGIYTCSTYYK